MGIIIVEIVEDIDEANAKVANFKKAWSATKTGSVTEGKVRCKYFFNIEVIIVR